MRVTINETDHELPAAASVADAIAAAAVRPPFAVAVNLQFVPRDQYRSVPLHEADRVEIIAPVTGG